MDIELHLRENLVLQDPGMRFTEGVLSRLGEAPRASGEGVVRLADERARRRKRILVGVLLVAGVAAAMLVLWLRRSSDEVAVQVVAPPPAVPAAVPAEEPVVEAPATPAPPPAAKPIAPPATFTVRVKPLANPDNLGAGLDVAQRFRDRLVSRLQAIPNVVLVDGADDGKVIVDYEVRLRLENPPGIVGEMLGGMAPALHYVLVDAGPPSRFAPMDARLAAEAQMSPAERERSQQGRRMASFRGRTAGIITNGMPATVALVDQPITASGADPADHEAAEVVRTLRNTIFPVDAAYKQTTLATLRDTGVPFNERLTAESDLLRMERRDKFSTMDAEEIRAGADLALTMPETLLRSVAWENMLETKHPELIPQIARALDAEPDTDIRLRLIKSLASDFPDDPAAVKVLETASRQNGQELVRMAALREVQGGASWNAYVAASLVDTRLSDEQRLQPIANMADPAKTQATASLVLDDKPVRELIAVANRVAVSGKLSQAMDAILALRFVDSPQLADRLIEIVRAPVTASDTLGLQSTTLKSAAIGVATVRFPDDRRFPALLDELAASSDPKISSWARDQAEMMAAATNPDARKAYFEKMMKEIMPK